MTQQTAAEARPRLSGWCRSAPGARPKCGGCRMDGCECVCHQEES